ncbi:transposase [Sphingomonas sp. AOB5]|uniref:transposase n=1 Tax=Sphingomonas sp. AOB5 TaxID=3034017 RepID=UPI0023F8387F|nr:transposase [Sphingomonas sp. AOB5]MDF7777950.1 transposase [Sphingomonas sp. AOB5]
MPRLIDPGDGGPIGVGELVEALEATPVDVRDEDAFASLGPLLARLGRNRDFLADMAIAELKTRCEGQLAANGYGAQSFLLRPPNGRYLLRANFWPARQDPVTRASGTAAFFYDLPHDHNFPFLTWGYLGPGYWSDYYEYDVDAVTGLPGEDAGLRFVERSRLEPDKLMLYRMRRDVHVQLPPDAFSVSLNILGSDPAQPWLDQYVFDMEAGTIARAITCTAAEALVTLSVHFGGNGTDLAADFAVRHPCERMRVTALAALASADPREAVSILERAAASTSAYVAGHARLRLAALMRQTAP